MKRVLGIIAIAAIAQADAPAPPPPALSAIDSVPTKSQLDVVFGTPSLPGVLAYVQDMQDPGARLRAIHALVQYCAAPCGDLDPAHAPLVQILTDNANALAGSDLLVLRAAIESLGPMQDLNDLDQLKSFLNHPSRDVRATTALALGDLCNTNAIQYLHTRLQNEGVDQVRLAISSALRALNQCPVTP
jgi:HEAT repeat protein